MEQYALLQKDMQWISSNYCPTEEIEDAKLYDTLEELKKDLLTFDEPNSVLIVKVYIKEQRAVIRDYTYEILGKESE